MYQVEEPEGLQGTWSFMSNLTRFTRMAVFGFVVSLIQPNSIINPMRLTTE